MIINSASYNQSLVAAFKRGYRIGISNDPRGRYKHPDVYRLGKEGKIALSLDSQGNAFFMADLYIDQINVQKKIYHKDFILFMRYGYLSAPHEIATDEERRIFEKALTDRRRGHYARRLLSGLIYGVTTGYTVTKSGILVSPLGEKPIYIFPSTRFFKGPVKYINHANKKIGYFAVSHLMAFQKYGFEIFKTDQWEIIARNGDLRDCSCNNILLNRKRTGA